MKFMISPFILRGSLAILTDSEITNFHLIMTDLWFTVTCGENYWVSFWNHFMHDFYWDKKLNKALYNYILSKRENDTREQMTRNMSSKLTLLKFEKIIMHNYSIWINILFVLLYFLLLRDLNRIPTTTSTAGGRTFNLSFDISWIRWKKA